MPLLHASAFEFKRRVWIFGFLYLIGFWGGYRLDPHNLSDWLLHLVHGDGYDLGSGHGAFELRALFTFGSILAMAGAALRTWAAAYLTSDVVHDQELHAETLVADGPYRYVRNPLYLGVLLLTIGIGMAASRLGFVFLVLAVWIFERRLIGREEGELRASQGERVRAYFDAVPRFFPSFRPRLPGSGRKPVWSQAFPGEVFLWIFALGSLVFALTFDGRLFATVSIGAFFAFGAFYSLSTRLRR